MKTLSTLLLLGCVAYTQCFGAATFDGTPGTGAPPSSLGPYSMTAFPLNNSDPAPGSLSLNSVASPLGGDLVFSVPLDHTRVVAGGPYRAGYGIWGNGYVGDTYSTATLGAPSLTMTLPPGTAAFYFYSQPDNDTTPTLFEVTTSDGADTGVLSVNGPAGAKYFGFYESNPGVSIQSITLSAPNAGEYGVGEFGIAVVPEPATLALVGIGICMLLGKRLIRKT